MDCKFCEVIKGNRPAKIVYEDAYTLVTMDKAGDADGHMLVMPKKHVNNILDTDMETLNHLMATVKKVSNHCVDHCGYEGINLIGTNGPGADQTIPHFHMHVIPRKKDDGIEAWPEFGGAKHDMEEIYEKLKMMRDDSKQKASMRLLFCVDKKDYEENWSRFARPSVRGIIWKDGKLAMVHSLKYGYYKFPGGGIEGNEAHGATLIREVKEETGLTVKPETIREYGFVLRLQKSDYLENTIFEQENFYYTCEVTEETGEQKLDDYEAEEGFTLEFLTPEEAIRANQNCHCSEWDKAMVERETRILEGLKKEQKELPFTYRLATLQDLDAIWNKNIANNPEDGRWVYWKEEYVRYNRTGMAQTYVVVCGEEPVGECTLIFSPKCNAVRGRMELADGEKTANINALRISEEYEGQGHVSKLMKYVEDAAKARNIQALTIGVEAKETRNLGIYLHWGYDIFVKSENEENEPVLYYRKELR